MDLDALINSDDPDGLKRRGSTEPETQEFSVKRSSTEFQQEQQEQQQESQIQPPPQKIIKGAGEVAAEGENEDSEYEYEYEEEQGTIDEVTNDVFTEISFPKPITATPAVTAPAPATPPYAQVVQPQEESFSGKASLCVTLVLGRLTSRVRLFPDPTPTIELERRAEPSLPYTAFPKCLGIAGFLSAKTLPSPPSISSHRILPPKIQPQALSAEVPGSCPPSSERNGKEILGVMLSSALFTQRLTAVVALGPEWRGIITAPELGKLVLHILKPRIVLPGLGPLHTLATLSSLMLAGCTAFKEPEIPLGVASYNHRGKTSGPESGGGNEEESATKIPFGKTPLLPGRNMVYASFAQFEKLTFSLPGSYNELSKIFDRIVAMSKSFHESANVLGLFCTFVQKCYSNAESRKQQGLSLFKELYEKSKHYQKNQTQKSD